MAERASVLAHLPRPPAAPGATTVREIRTGAIVQIAAWPDTLQLVKGAMADLGLPVAEQGMGVANDAATTLALAPGRHLVLSDDPGLPARLEGALLSTVAAVTDISHGRSVIRLNGPDAVSVLLKGVAVDLDIHAFPPGRVAQTAIHHVDVTIFRQGDESFDLIVLRGFAEAFAEWLLDAGLEKGIEFRA